MRRVFLVRGNEADPSVARGVRRLLATVDEEFVPALSARSDTMSTVPVAALTHGALGNYLDSMRAESWLVALDGNEVIGLLSFRTKHDESLLRAWSPSLHATTLGVQPSLRRAGVATHLYDALERLAGEFCLPYLTTRTWTTNASHLGLLRSRGFKSVAQLSHHRSDGIGTVYLAYDASSTVSCPRPRTSLLLGDHALRED